jgi:Spy/CpxP family protein refolding chaperone
VATQIRGRSSAQNLRGTGGVEQQLRSRFFVSLGISRFFALARSVQVPNQPLTGGMMCRPPMKQKNKPPTRGERSMKVNQLLTICGVAAALMLSAGTVSAQNDNGGPGGGPGGGGGGRGNFDPAQFQQRMMDNIREQLGFTNDTEWNAVQPLIQKVTDARRDAGGGGGMGRMFGRNRGGQGGGGGRGGFGPQPSPEAEALQNAIDANAPTAQIKDALAKYEASQKAKQAKLVQAQEDLRKVLTTKQEAQATLLGLLQ